MKKMLAVILILAMLIPVAVLADTDVKSLTDQELNELISACSAELMARHASDPEGIMLFEYEQIRVYQTGDAYIDKSGYLCVPVAVYNDMDHEMVISAEKATCNGWDIYADNCRATGKAKNKDDIKFKISDADATGIDQIDSITFSWQVYDFSEYKILFIQEEREEHRFW